MNICIYTLNWHDILILFICKSRAEQLTEVHSALCINANLHFSAKKWVCAWHNCAGGTELRYRYKQEQNGYREHWDFSRLAAQLVVQLSIPNLDAK